MEQHQRGVLYPQRLPEFHRLPPRPEAAHAMSWFWIPEWDLPEGEESRQQILPLPACNLVVEPDEVSVVGPPTRRSERVLTGRGWAVGALLRPAAAAALIPDLGELRDSARRVEAPDLHRVVSDAMSDPGLDGDARRAAAARAVSDWIAARVPLPAPGSADALANELATALADPAVTRVAQLAPILHTSTRTLQRLARRCFGLSLHSMIRRRRLQEAAERLRSDPEATVASLASELGYADHAHFTTDFSALLGLTPSSYREGFRS